MSLQSLIDLDRLSRFKQKVDTELAKKQDKPYEFQVFDDTTYTVTRAPGTIEELMLSVVNKDAPALTIYDIDTITARYTMGEVYPLSGNAVAVLFKQMAPTIDVSSQLITGASAHAVALIGSYSSTDADAAITWQFVDLGDVPLATQSELSDYTTINDVENILGAMLSAPIVVMSLASDTLSIDLSSGQPSGTPPNLNSVANYIGSGLTVFFALPLSYITGNSGDGQQLVCFTLVRMDQNNMTLTLATTHDGTLYWADMSPTSTTAMSGTLNSLKIPAKTSELINDSGFLTTETDPTVPTWAKAVSKPSYTASEVGALPSATNYAASQSVGGPANKAVSIPFAQVDSTSTATVFTATVDGITELRDGVCMWLKNGVVTSASGFTINVNGLGAKPVYGSLAAATRSTTIFNVNYTMLFIYNSSRVSGGCWDCVYGYDSNSNTIGYQLRRNNGTYLAKNAVHRYMLLLSYSPTQVLPINTTSNSTGTSKTLTTEEFDPFGPIWYYSATTDVAAGSAIAIASMWEQYTLDLRYSFNTGTSLTNNKDVFIVAVPQANGRAKLHSAPITQTLPTTEDGRIYIYLGHAYSTSSIVLAQDHPIYCYRNGGIQQWTGVQREIDSIKAQLDALVVLDEEVF